MEKRLSQSQQTTTALTLAPLQVRYVRLLEMNASEAEDAALRELDANPALAVGEEGGSSSVPTSLPTSVGRMAGNIFPSRGTDDAEQSFFGRQTSTETLYEALVRQLHEKALSPRVAHAADYIIGNLDNNGYLRRPLSALVNEIAINDAMELTDEEAEEALAEVRSLDPPGVGAANLRDSLILQLQSEKRGSRRDLALDIVTNHFDLFMQMQLPKLYAALDASRDEVDDAIELIRSLNPKPGAAFSPSGMPDGAATVIPDFIVEKEGGQLRVTLSNNIPELTVSESFREAERMMRRNAAQRKGRSPGDKVYISGRIGEARDFIKIMERRQSTLYDVMTAIVHIQHDYFLTGNPLMLRPMALKDIGGMTGHDLSTISRATANKYVETAWGTFPLRYFFSEKFGASPQGEGKDSVSGRRLQEEIRAMIDAEDKRHPLSDEQICLRLREKGYDVSRRTVNKYRDRLDIPVARRRRK